ncbi:DUF6355 family natural product biosynthesis protein [Nocardia sp. NPDC004168]|uniref:DUF6355 family natural product biosynthesis protein n=1 Tax=Nocardia sp. NPDC004168 TaxID=3154452 RepID=UPI0033A4D416
MEIYAMKKLHLILAAAIGISSPVLLLEPLASAQDASTQFHSIAASCGYYTEPTQGAVYAYWKNCTGQGQQINVDLAEWPDEHRCVGAGQTAGLGSVGTLPGDVRNATAIGTC